MHHPSTSARLSPVLVHARLSELAEALDGYPADTLIDAWLEVPDPNSAASRGARRVARQALSRWAAILSRDIDLIPPKSVDALEAVRRRMTATRDALVLAATMTDELGESAVEPGSGAPGAAIEH